MMMNPSWDSKTESFLSNHPLKTWISGWGKGESKHLIIYKVFAPSKRWLALGFLNHQLAGISKWFLMLQPWRSASWRFHWYLRARCLAQRYRMGCLGEGKDVQQQNAGLKQLKLMATSPEFYFKGQQKGLEDSCEVLSLFCFGAYFGALKVAPIYPRIMVLETKCQNIMVNSYYKLPRQNKDNPLKTLSLAELPFWGENSACHFWFGCKIFVENIKTPVLLVRWWKLFPSFLRVLWLARSPWPGVLYGSPRSGGFMEFARGK